MWRRPRTSACPALRLSASTAAAAAAVRTITSRGQFNPIHDFDAHNASPATRATTPEQFQQMIENPGPLRVTYSPDYLDWLYKGYQNRVRYLEQRQKAEERFQGSLLTSGNGKQQQQHAGSAAEWEGGAPAGMFTRPRHSIRRVAGEQKRQAAQATLDRVAKQQGWLDLFERQPQFPALHLEQASRFHYVELFKELVLDRALAPVEVWDKALLYRAILQERRAAYPPSFGYIFAEVENCVLAAGEQSNNQLQQRCPTQANADYFVYMVKKYYIDNAVEGHVLLRCHREPHAKDLLFSNPPPKSDEEVRAAMLQETLGAKKDAAAPAATDAPAEDSNNAAPAAAPAAAPTMRVEVPALYPPIEALWRCEENLPLLKVLVFGELNLLVSENPFVKFPQAQAALTRPYVAEDASAAPGGAAAAGATADNRRGGGANNNNRAGGNRSRAGGAGAQDAISLASVIADRRGHLLAPIPRNTAMAIDGRASDVRRQQQRHHREDIAAFHALLKRGGDDGAGAGDGATYTAYSDWFYLNPRAVRAEERDGLHREGLAALKLYDQASRDMYRASYADVENATATRPIEGDNTAPSYIPTLPHFVATVAKDRHVSFLQHVLLGSEDYQSPASLSTSSNGSNSSNSTLSQAERAQQLEKLVFQLARALHQTALEYHVERSRRIHRQKVNVAACLLDRFIESEWERYLQQAALTRASQQPLNSNGGAEDAVSGMARRLGSPQKFETRILDESGFPTDARMDDYARWMEAPAAQQ